MRTWIILTFVLALLGAGCGDTGSDEPVPTSSTTTGAEEQAGGTDPDPATGTDGNVDGEEEPATVPPIEEDTLVTTPDDDKDVPETTVPAAGEPGVIDPGLQPYIDIAVADLAGRLGVDPAGIAVVSAEVTVWNDASLGCPQPGMNYAQVLEDGSLIVLEVQGTAYRYHSGGFRAPFLCESS